MENKVMNKEERIREKERLSNIVTSKMMAVFFVLIFAVVLLFRLSSSAGAELALYMAMPYIQIGAAVLFVLAFVWHILCSKRGVQAKEHVFSSPLLLGIASAFLCSALLYMNFGAFRTILMLLAFGLLFFVYQIYALDFFLCSVAVITGCLSASVINNAGFSGMNVLVNCVAVLAAVGVALACAGLIYKLTKERKVTVFGKVFKRPARMNHLAVYVGCLAAVLSVLAVLLFGHLLYCIAAVCVVYFVIAIIYTVKLI